MTQTFNDSVQILGTQDVIQLTVRGAATQGQPLQVWQDNASNPLARLTAGGRLELGTTFGGAADALIQANYTPSSGMAPSVWHAAGTVANPGTPLNWVYHEVQISGTAAVNSLHNALYTKLTHTNSGAGTAAELRAATFQTINQAGSSGAPTGQATGLRATASNAGSAYLSKAAGVEATLTNATGGSISQAAAFTVVAPTNQGTLGTLYGLQIPDLTQGSANYAIYTGQGPIHVGDYQEVKVFDTTPAGNPPANFIKVYPKLNAGVPNLYGKDASGTEYNLSGTGGGGGSLTPADQAATKLFRYFTLL